MLILFFGQMLSTCAETERAMNEASERGEKRTPDAALKRLELKQAKVGLNSAGRGGVCAKI